MHSAPSVRYPVGRSPFAGAFLLLTWLLGAVAAVLWWAQDDGWRPATAALLLACVGAAAAWGWWHSPVGTLAWDGEGWNWSTPAGLEAGEPDPCLDLQHRLLVRWNGTRRRWLWLERASGAERWDDLRRAVYSRARPKAPRHDQQPAATP